MFCVAKEIRINVRTTAQIKRELEIAARLKGIKPSSLVNWAVVQAIREEKERDPQAFRQSNVEPSKDHKVRHVRNLGELTDETKKKAGKR